MHVAARARAYKEVQMTTATPGQILLALYDTAIRYSRMAGESIRAGNVALKGQQLQRVSDIVAELTSTLNHQAAPELCVTLEQLYFYVQERLSHANSQLDADAAVEVGRLLETLRSGWAEAVEQVEGPRARATRR